MKKKLNYFRIPSLGSMAKSYYSPTISVPDEYQSPSAASAATDNNDGDDDDDDGDLEGVFRLHDIERVGAKRDLLDFQDGVRAKKC